MQKPIIIVRKRKPARASGAHAGSWKIVFADFMTSMMAFFLVMWLLAIASPQELTRLAEYFRTPLEVALNKGERSSSDFSPIPGGGEDPTRQEGNVHMGLAPSEAGQDAVKLKRLREVLEQLIANDPRLQKLRPQLLIDLVEEGLRIQIIDNQNRPMFSTGSAEVAPYMSVILRTIAPVLNDIPYKISISGHTDATPYANGGHGYSNWELSADRANASRRELVLGGLAENKVLGVVGMASTINLDNQHPDAAINRRISLLVLNKRTERSLAHENGQNQDVLVDGADVRQRPDLLHDVSAADGAAPTK
ncbi:flagellar motor protein MotB [Sodalis endosymbiont of Spalangia cameroni]|uniref:flagellar motor protein MotB n=1 Tax=Sodalis praecaptivus TaxID=1239307 RepID=UPI0031F91EEF